MKLNFYIQFTEGTDKEGKRYQKIYFLSKASENWVVAAASCHRVGLQFLTLDTKNESIAFTEMVEKEDQSLLDEWVFVGGVVRIDGTRKDWMWMETGKPVDYEIDFSPGEPNFPAYEHCLAFSVKRTGNLKYHDLQCSTWRQKYFCQKRIEI